MFKRPVVLSAAALLVMLSAGCGFAPQSQMVSSSQMGSASALKKAAPKGDAAPATKEAFIAAAKAKGVKLTDADLAVIQAERTVKPNGIWAPRPAENLTAQRNLEVHQQKHGHEFRPALSTPEAYLSQGNAAGNGSRGTVRFFFDTTSFDKGYQSHVVRWVPPTNDFTAFRADGSETTYYQSAPKPGRFIECPIW
jgi:hypothetical protein